MDATVWTSAIIAAVIAILALPHPGEPAVAYAIGPGSSTSLRAHSMPDSAARVCTAAAGR